MMKFRPQPGPQAEFLSTHADIAIYGGGAGSGKSFALLLEPLYYIGVPGFQAVGFRRTVPEIRNPGGLWDESKKIYYGVGGTPQQSPMHQWNFPSGARVSFAHLENDQAVMNWHGSQIALILYDELTTFCLSPDHDVLTDRGWVPIDQVTTDDKVLSRIGEKAEFRRVLDTPSFDHDGDMIEVRQRNGISLKATPNHRVLVQRQDKNRSLGFVDAENLSDTIQVIPRQADLDRPDMTDPVRFESMSGRGFGHNQNSTEEIDRDLWLEFLGWYLSEGCAFGKTVKICQLKESPELESLMERLPWRSKYYPKGWQINSRQLAEYLIPFGNTYEKRVPRWVMDCSPRQIRIFLDAFVLGDGWKHQNGSVHIGLGNRGLRDDLQELYTLSGRVSTASDSVVGRRGVLRGQGSPDDTFNVYSLSVSQESRTDTMVKPESVTRSPYSGKVYCLTVDCPPMKDFTRGGYERPDVPGGNFLVRHNGRVHFTGNSETQFWYLLSRNRTTCGVAPRIRATTNPDADSWVARFLDWWIGDDGYPIEERSGVLRWFIRLGDSIKWGDSRKELLKYKDPDGNPIPPKSMTFIPAKLTDNQILMKQDPTYIANLMALSTIDRERLLLGNWKIRPASGDFFRRQWVGAPVEILPSFKDTLRKVRGWDLGATEAREGRDPDWTCGTLIGEEQGQKKYYVLDHKFDRLSPDGVERLILETAKLDGRQTRIEIPQDPAQAGKAQKLSLLKLLAGYDVRFRPASGDKITRFKGFSAQAEGGNVTVALGDWNERWFRELENFPPKHGHDDDADATAQAFNGLLRALPRPVTGFYSGFH